MEYTNKQASTYYAAMHACAQKEGATGQSCNKENPLPYVIAEYEQNEDLRYTTGGVLWYRGYSHKEVGNAGSKERCKDGEDVCDQFGCTAMVVAHTTHKKITKYCHKEAYDNDPPVYVVDTHSSDCYKTGECDFGTTEAHRFHKGGKIDHEKAKMVPQALMQTFLVVTPGKEWSSLSTQRCLSKVDGSGVTVECNDLK
mmetsp:Transcript_112592/g.318922  ORF Transcript_112592/g.318922 Transcript_112592/m.318922 type:complete len:198 (-) Transcript_112592:43-636(-)